MNTSFRTGVAVLSVALASILVLAGCGSSGSSTTSPSPTPSKTGIAQNAKALKKYVQQVSPIAAGIVSAVQSVPTDLKGIGKKPGNSWKKASAKLNATAAQLGQQVSQLSALTPPPALAGLQQQFVAGVQKVQGGIQKVSSALAKGQAKWVQYQSRLSAALNALQAKIASMSSQFGSLLGGASPSP